MTYLELLEFTREHSNVVDFVTPIAGGYPDGHMLIPWLSTGSPIRGLSPHSGLRKPSRGLESPAGTARDSTESECSHLRPKFAAGLFL